METPIRAWIDWLHVLDDSRNLCTSDRKLHLLVQRLINIFHGHGFESIWPNKEIANILTPQEMYREV